MLLVQQVMMSRLRRESRGILRLMKEIDFIVIHVRVQDGKDGVFQLAKI